MKNIDSIGHVTGRSIYLDDIPIIQGTLHAAVFGSPFAHGKIESIDFSHALEQKGVRCVITHKDIPGENQIGGIIPDEELLASKEVHFRGQPIAIVIAETEQIASEARKLIRVNITEREVITNPKSKRNRSPDHPSPHISDRGYRCSLAKLYIPRRRKYTYKRTGALVY